MPGFVQGELKNKLTILYFMKVVDVELTRDQVHRTIVENDCMNYLEFCSAMYDLEEDGLILALPRPFGQAYRISGKGESTLSMLEESIPFSLKQRLSGYADSERAGLVTETQLVSSMRELPNGSYLVSLSANEKDETVLHIDMRLASRNMAKKVREKWESASEEIYSTILDRLLFSETEEK